jgi:serine/threonine-protein kinase
MSSEPQTKERITMRPEAAKRAPSESSGARETASSTRSRLTKQQVAETSHAAGKIIAGRYRVERLLGSGGMGSVYEATQLAIGRRVAVKVLRPDMADDPLIEARFEREARAAASVHHPNVVVVHEFGRGDDGALFLAMELLPGESLLARLRRLKGAGDSALSPREAVGFAIEIASALEAAHAAGVVHRDLKPDNVTLLASGGLKVLDFGIARILQDERDDAREDRAQLTDAQQVLGTPRYISPEAVARLPVGPSADLYALGCILFEMLTGRPVFLDREPVILMGQHLREAPPKLRDASPGLAAPVALEALVDELLRKLPTDRPATASAVRQRLASLDWSGRLVRDVTRPSRPPPILPDDLEEVDDDLSAPAPASKPAPAMPSAPVRLEARPPAPTLTPEALHFQPPSATPAGADWITPRGPRRPSMLSRAVLVLCVATVAGLLVAHRMRLDAQRAQLLETGAQPTTAPAAPLGPREVEANITVHTSTPDAVFRWDDELMPGPSFHVVVDGRTHRLEVSARGHATRRVDVVADGPHTLDVPLTHSRSRRR